MSSTPLPSQYARDKLANLLRSMRVRSQLTSAAAAQRAGFSQSKLSKIENGALLLSFADGEALCRAYGATADQRDEVLDLLKLLHDEMESARIVLRRGAHRKQQAYALIEAETALYRDLQVAYVSGLLQTPAYIRHMAGTAMNDSDREKHVAARIARQRVLDDETKSFVFVMTEGALRWRAGSSQVMAEQIEHITEISARPNVRVGVIPWTASAPHGVMPGHEVHIYDDRLVVIGILTATANIQDPRDIEQYLVQFAALEAVASFGAAGRAELERIAGDFAGS
ncbi:helix-turn-helix transcriptional regulator [Nonomuraea longicatena]|uniref:Helix-turn-helix transcriptional regulator n=1 Tax=Nonomuraea longicatena TaxID=83682 RepID=A0ABP3Z6V6_9ACTN